MIKATFKQLSTIDVTYNKSGKYFANGVTNDYTEVLEAVRVNSVTASVSSNLMIQFIIGKGLGEFDNFEINGIKAIDLLEDLASNIVDNRGVFVKFDFDANGIVSGYEVLPFASCRIGQFDDDKYNGKIVYKHDWQDTKEEEKFFNVFDPNPEVVKYQIEKAGGIDYYKGQIFFYNMDRRLIYPLNRLHAVANECDNEYQAGVYKNTIVRRGFFGKTLVVTRPLISDDVYNDKSEEGIRELREAESERDNFKRKIDEFIGAENTGGVMHVELEYESEDLDKAILFKNIESNINPDMFKVLEDTAVVKILMAYNNLPVMLVKSPDSSMFGNSGEAIREAKLMYWEATSKERNIVETLFNDFWKLHVDFDGEYKYITNLIEDEQPIDNDTAYSGVETDKQFDKTRNNAPIHKGRTNTGLSAFNWERLIQFIGIKP